MPFDTGLWDRLAAMRIEPEGARLTFAARLAKEQGWSPGHAERVVEEYRRFLYLAATLKPEITPSVQVDEAWHLHLTYSRHYWEELCGRILRKPLHHLPTEGGAEEAARHRRQYEATRSAYAQTFDAPTPADIWPSCGEAVGQERQWRLASALAVAGGGAFLLAACTALAGNAAESGGVRPLPIIIGMLAIILGLSIMFGRRNKGKGRGRRGPGDCGGDSSCGSDSGDGGSSCGGGGCGGGGGGD
jgi:hypothetical protein